MTTELTEIIDKEGHLHKVTINDRMFIHREYDVDGEFISSEGIPYA